MSRKNCDVPLSDLREAYDKFGRLPDESQSRAMTNGAVRYGTFEEFCRATQMDILVRYVPQEAAKIVNETIRKIREQIRMVAQSHDISGLSKNPAELRAAVDRLKNEIAQKKGEKEAVHGSALRGSDRAWDRFYKLQEIVTKLQTDLEKAERELRSAEVVGRKL